MQTNDFFSLFTDRLNTIGIEYMITGSAVVVAYGEPRLTNDIDLVMSLSEQEAAELIEVFPGQLFYCPPEEILRTELNRKTRGHFNIIHHESGLKADCYLAGNDPFQAWGLQHRNRLTLAGHNVYLAPLEYVIVKKLQFYQEGKSEKHLRDIRSLLAVSGDEIDRPHLDQYILEFGLLESWQALRVKTR